MGVIASETIKDGFVVEFDVMNQFLYKHIVKYAEWLDDQSIKQQGWKMYGEGGAAAAQYDYTTTICREVEIMIYDLENVYGMTISDGMKQYFNMLSKVLYLIARIYEHQDDIK
jgi:cob(I)alamin adenosyltransferase